jgi:predicted helicase
VPENADEFTALLPIGSKTIKETKETDGEAVFKLFSVGVKTNRDEVVYNFNRPALAEQVKQFIEN